jgi:uncharacterized protein (DUF1800 family)
LSLALMVPAATRAAGDASESEALHVLNRLSLGPAPGELARVMQIGVDRYIDEQLHPERLPMPPTLTQALATLDASSASQRELVVQFRTAMQAAKNDSEDGKARRQALFQRQAQAAAEIRLLQALQSPRQLQEVMVDFWFNHFNIFVGKGLDRVLVGNYEREVIRPYALGRFRDLLGATAHHPAMLFYLDNWLSVAPDFRPRRAGGPLAKASGLNENYARELMELHTLGVDGGYTQRDVTELARMLTGWTSNPRGQGDSAFYFDARRHDDGDKTWLGRPVPARGQAEGEWALDVLASHPATARHLSFKLAQYFVSDDPPAALVDRLSRRFLATDGDIRAVLATLFASAEFRNPAVRGAKFKTPYQFVLSAVRAAGVPVGNVRPLLAVLQQLGMPLYGCLTPDGYKNTEAAWLNPDAVTRRINFATALAAGRLPLARPLEEANADRLDRGPSGGASKLDAEAVLATVGSAVSAKTRAAVAEAEPALRAALVLGSPDFMRR